MLYKCPVLLYYDQKLKTLNEYNVIKLMNLGRFKVVLYDDQSQVPIIHSIVTLWSARGVSLHLVR